MIESFVDLTYRSLPLGRRVKLTQVRPTTGYLEVPAPMPVGSTIAISTDEGVTLQATVSAVHEQVGGSDRQPGMLVTPVLAQDDKASSWWQARVALPELPARATIPDLVEAGVLPANARPRRTAEMPTLGATQHVEDPVIEALPPEAVAAAAASEREEQAKADALSRAEDEADARRMPAVSRTGTVFDRANLDPAEGAATGTSAPVIDDGVRTTVMQAIDDPVLIDQLPVEPPIIDDGKKTVVMAAVDVRALGLEPSQSGEIAVVEAGGDDDADDSDKSDANGKKSGPNKRRRGKRR